MFWFFDTELETARTSYIYTCMLQLGWEKLSFLMRWKKPTCINWHFQLCYYNNFQVLGKKVTFEYKSILLGILTATHVPYSFKTLFHQWEKHHSLRLQGCALKTDYLKSSTKKFCCKTVPHLSQVRTQSNIKKNSNKFTKMLYRSE